MRLQYKCLRFQHIWFGSSYIVLACVKVTNIFSSPRGIAKRRRAFHDICESHGKLFFFQQCHVDFTPASHPHLNPPFPNSKRRLSADIIFIFQTFHLQQRDIHEVTLTGNLQSQFGQNWCWDLRWDASFELLKDRGPN